MAGQRASYRCGGSDDKPWQGPGSRSHRTIDTAGGRGALAGAETITVGEGEKGNPAAPAVSPRS